MFLQFVIWVDVGPEEAITEEEKPKKARPHVLKTTATQNCEWACHVPPSRWWRDESIWTDNGLKLTRLPSLWRRRLSEAVDDCFIQMWPGSWSSSVFVKSRVLLSFTSPPSNIFPCILRCLPVSSCTQTDAMYIKLIWIQSTVTVSLHLCSCLLLEYILGHADFEFQTLLY